MLWYSMEVRSIRMSAMVFYESSVMLWNIIESKKTITNITRNKRT